LKHFPARYEPDCDRVIPRTTLASGPAIWLLTIQWAGRVMRYSSRPVKVTSESSGEVLVFRGRLPQLDVSQAIDAMGQVAQVPSVSISLPLFEDAAQIISHGARLDEAQAELAWWVEGTTWERRQVLIDGPLQFGGYLDAGEPITFTLEPTIKGGGRHILGARSEVSEDTVGTGYVEEDGGERYPLVFGQPGFRKSRFYQGSGGAATATRVYPGTLAPRWKEGGGVVTDILMCARHVAVAGDVEVFFWGCNDAGDDGHATLGAEYVEVGEDEEGRPITTLDVSSLTSAQQSAQYWAVQWTDSVGGVKLRESSTRTIVSSLTFSDWAFANTALYDLRPGDVVRKSYVVVSTGFDGGATIELDDSVASAIYITSGSVSLGTPGTYSTAGRVNILSSYFSTMQMTGAGSPTVGACKVYTQVRGVPGFDGGVNTLGDLVEWLLTRTSRDIDLARWLTLSRRLRVPVGGVLDPDLSYWENFTALCLPLMPVSLWNGPAGVAPVWWDWTGEQAPVWHLEDGVDGVILLPEISSARGDDQINTAVHVNYGWDVKDNVYRRQARLVPDPRIRPSSWATLEGDASSGDTELTAQRYGKRVLSIESKIIHTRTAADWWARWQMAACGWAHRLVKVEGSQREGSLELGDVVTLTAPAKYLTAVRGMVQEVAPTDTGRVQVTLLVQDRPSAQAVSTGPNSNQGPGDRVGGVIPS